MENQRFPWIKLLLLIMLITILAACQSATATPGIIPGQKMVTIEPATLSPQSATREPSTTASLSPTDLPQIIVAENIQNLEKITQFGKGTITNPVVFSPGGELFAVPVTTGVFLYDPQTFKEVAHLETDGLALNICFSPDGTLLATSGPSNNLQVWKMSDFSLAVEKKISSAEIQSIYQIGFSPDGKLLAVAYGPDNIVEILGVQNQELDQKYSGSWFSFSQDSAYLTTTEYGGEDINKRTIRLFKLSDTSEVNSWRGVKGFFAANDRLVIQRSETVQALDIVSDTAMAPVQGTQAVVSVNGQILALFDQGKVLLYDLPRGAISEVMAGQYSTVEELQFSPDLRYLAGLVSTEPVGCCGGGPDKIEVWQVQSGNPQFELSLNQFSRRAAFSPDGNYLVLADSDRIDFVSVQSAKITHTIEGFTNTVLGIAFSPTDQKLAAAYNGLRSVRIWNRNNGEIEKIIEDPNNSNLGTPSTLAYSPDGKILAVNGIFWDPSSSSRISALENKLLDTGTILTSVAFNPVQNSLAAGFFDASLRFWDYGTNTLLQEIRGSDGELVNLAFSKDGSMIAVVHGYPSFSVQVRSNEENYPLKFELTGGYYRQAIFSPDGQYLAVLNASREQASDLNPPGKVELWNLNERNKNLEFGTGNITRIAFSPDGKLLAGGLSDQGAVQVWDAKKGDLLRTLDGHFGHVIDVAFSPDGTTLASASEDGTILIWGLPNAGE